MAEDANIDREEKAPARMSFRARPHVAFVIRQAAALEGVGDTAFVMSAAYDAALETIARHERTFLQQEDHDAFLRALDDAFSSASKAL